MQSDARYRFERGVDPAFILPGLDLATAMMLEVAGGKPSKAKVAGAPPETTRTVIDFDLGRVEKLGGIALPEKQIRATLTALGFAIEGKGATVKVTAPSWRPDVHGSADLVEEVVRIAGLDKVPSAPMPRIERRGPPRADASAAARAPRAPRAGRPRPGRGHHLVVHPARRRRATSAAARMRWSSPIRSRARCRRCGRACCRACWRPSQRNRNRGFADVALFEVGQAYRGDGPKDQFIAASGVRAGAAALTGSGRHWAGAAKAADMFDAKADAFALLAALGFDAGEGAADARCAGLVPSRPLGALRLGPKIVLAHFGELHPETLALMDVAGPVAAFEVFLERVPAERKKGAGAAGLRMPPTCCPCAATSPSCSTATWRPAMSSRRRWRPTRS